MTFLDLFAGIGGFRRGLERSGHMPVGHVEIDSYANKSYMAMYDLKYCKYKKELNENSCMMCKKEVYESCDGTRCKGEWYAKDIKKIRAGEIPKAKIWTFGFPCTDLSVAGRMAGLYGERSGLFFTVTRLLKSTAPKNKPQYLILENVKHLVFSERGRDFTTVLFELWEAGYDCEWQVVNSKNFGVAQHRERVYLIGHLRGRSRREILPICGTNQAVVKQVIGGTQGNRVYHPDGLSITLTANAGGFGGRTGLYLMEQSFVDMNEKARITPYAHCVKARQNAGISHHKGECSGVFVCQGHPDCARAILNPFKKETRQNGRRIKEEGEPSFTLTTQDRHGILLCCYDEVIPMKEQEKQRLMNKDVQKKKQVGQYLCCRIRRLTPRETWRLQGFHDTLFEKAREAGMSDSQLYRQAGNAVTVSVVYEIGRRLKEIETICR